MNYLEGSLELSPEQSRFVARSMIHARLDEALYRVSEEPEKHLFRAIAKEEIAEIHDLATEQGLSEEDLQSLYDWITLNPWTGDEDEPYIGTEEGRDRYFGRTVIWATGPGFVLNGEQAKRLRNRF